MSRLPASRVHSHSCNDCPVQRSFCPLPADLRTVFEALKTTTALDKGETFFHEGEPCRSVFVTQLYTAVDYWVEIAFGFSRTCAGRDERGLPRKNRADGGLLMTIKPRECGDVLADGRQRTVWWRNSAGGRSNSFSRDNFRRSAE